MAFTSFTFTDFESTKADQLDLFTFGKSTGYDIDDSLDCFFGIFLGHFCFLSDSSDEFCFVHN